MRSLTGTMFENDERAAAIRHDLERKMRDADDTVGEISGLLEDKKRAEFQLTQDLQTAETRMSMTQAELEDKARAEIELTKQVQVRFEMGFWEY